MLVAVGQMQPLVRAASADSSQIETQSGTLGRREVAPERTDWLKI